MKIIKQWSTCVLSALLGVLGLVLSLCNGMTVKIAVQGQDTETLTHAAHETITDNKLMDEAKMLDAQGEFTFLKVMAIIVMIVSILLIVYAIVRLLVNLNVIKFQNKMWEIIGLSLLGVMLVSTILLMVASGNYANVVDKNTTDGYVAYIVGMSHNTITEAVARTMVAVDVTVGIYQILMLTFSIVFMIAALVVAFIPAKKRAANN